MLDHDSLIRALGELAPETDRAEIALIVLRLPGEGRETPPSATLDPERGVLGDRWSASRRPKPEAQVTLMRWDFASILTSDPAILGDNLFASIDTSARNLPPGTVLEIGAARCVVTPKPHTGCAKFSARVGAEALALTRAAAWKERQLRGVHLRVLQGGVVSLGDALRVVSRP